jgi:hypothetical protein
MEQLGKLIGHALRVCLIGQPREGLVGLLHQLRWILGPQPT